MVETEKLAHLIEPTGGGLFPWLYLLRWLL